MSEPPPQQPAPSRPRKRRLLRRLLRAGQWTLNTAFVLWLILVFTPAGNFLGNRLTHIDPLAKADYIVLLGGETARAVEAANLHRRGWAPKVIITSWSDDTDRLAEIARHYGLPAEAILYDRRAWRTASHPRTVAELPGVDTENHRFIILTSPYHTARARACFVKAGYKHVIARGLPWRRGGQFAPPARRWPERMRCLPGQLREVIGWAIYAALGWV